MLNKKQDNCVPSAFVPMSSFLLFVADLKLSRTLFLLFPINGVWHLDFTA